MRDADGRLWGCFVFDGCECGFSRSSAHGMYAAFAPPRTANPRCRRSRWRLLRFISFTKLAFSPRPCREFGGGGPDVCRGLCAAFVVGIFAACAFVLCRVCSSRWGGPCVVFGSCGFFWNGGAWRCGIKRHTRPLLSCICRRQRCSHLRNEPTACKTP